MGGQRSQRPFGCRAAGLQHCMFMPIVAAAAISLSIVNRCAAPREELVYFCFCARGFDLSRDFLLFMTCSPANPLGALCLEKVLETFVDCSFARRGENYPHLSLFSPCLSARAPLLRT